jgi:hypothetical protein
MVCYKTITAMRYSYRTNFVCRTLCFVENIHKLAIYLVEDKHIIGYGSLSGIPPKSNVYHLMSKD